MIIMCRKISGSKQRWTVMIRSAFLLLIPGLSGMAVHSQGNANSPAIYKSAESLTFLTDNSRSNIAGIYKMGGGLSGIIINVDSSGRFQKRGYSCLGGRFLDSGLCVLYKTGRIGLKSKEKIQTFDVVKFNHYFFLISPETRIAFINDFRKTEDEYRNVKTFRAEDQVFTFADLIVAHLMNNYYARNLLDQ